MVRRAPLGAAIGFCFAFLLGPFPNEMRSGRAYPPTSGWVHVLWAAGAVAGGALGAVMTPRRPEGPT